MRARSLLPLAVAYFAAGCAVGPAYHRPQAAVPSRWTAPTATGTSAGVSPVDDAWWKSFRDTELDALVLRAVQQNYDLKASIARVQEARASLGTSKSSFYPQINAGVSAERARQFGVGLVPAPQTPAGVRAQPFPYETNEYRGEFDAAWELDVFGRIRRQTQAARADLRASEQDRRGVLIAVIADVARYYAELRGAQLRLGIANKNVAVAEDEVKLTRDLAQAGQATQRDVAQAETQLETLRAQIPQLDFAIESSIHRLSVLTGQQPGALRQELTTAAALPVVPPEIPVGLPSDLLTRRPDIESANAQLAAATARVGEAKADYFPRFTLFGTAGRQATQLHDLTLGLGNYFAAGPSVSLPVFTGGRIRSNVAFRSAQAREALDVYQRTVLVALEETENGLVNYADEQSRRDHLEASVRSSQDAMNLADAQYRAGLADFLTVLDAERTLFTNEDLLAQSQTEIVVDLVALYKALGGGWQPFPLEAKTGNGIPYPQ